MATPFWRPGEVYLPGDLVQPATSTSPVYVDLANPDFESGDTGWTKGGNWQINNNPGFAGTWCAQFPGIGTGELVNSAEASIAPGQSVSASCMCKPSTGTDAARVKLYWFDASHAAISASEGSLVQGSGGWRESSVTGIAPAGAAYVRAGVSTSKNSGTVVSVDTFRWTLPYQPVVEGLIYKAVQPAAGTSASAEPAWPLGLGVQVIDNTVTWEAVQASRVVWQASPILTTGTTEPAWPLLPGAYVSDGTVSWEAISRRVEDANCPNSKAVVIMASKVFAGDRDIVRFSATANPLDWSTAADAGFLPTGLQQANSNDVAVLNQYRGNLVAFNASTFQMWQADPDPSAMALLDQMEGIGSIWQQAAQSVGKELFFLSALGVRTVGMAVGSTNLADGDVGMPIDPLVQDAIAAAGDRAVATYYPGAGQYWLAFPNFPNAGISRVFVYTRTQVGQVGAWSRYTYPFAIESFAQLGNDLYVRHGDRVSRISEDALTDDTDDGPVEFPGTVWWPWLDLGTAGVTKMLEGFDIVSEGVPSVSVGYDQRDVSAFTEPYPVPADTLPGGIIPLAVSAPSMSIRVDFEPGQAWELTAMTLYLHDNRGGA